MITTVLVGFAFDVSPTIYAAHVRSHAFIDARTARAELLAPGMVHLRGRRRTSPPARPLRQGKTDLHCAPQRSGHGAGIKESSMSEVATLRSIVRNEDGGFSVTFEAAGRSWQMSAKTDEEGIEVEFDDDLSAAVDLLDREDDDLNEQELVLREIGLIADGIMETLASSGLLGDLAALEERFDDGWEEAEEETIQA
jgi:hypothetical protein